VTELIDVVQLITWTPVNGEHSPVTQRACSTVAVRHHRILLDQLTNQGLSRIFTRVNICERKGTS